MLKLNIGSKELKVKFSYEATLKTRLLSKLAKNNSQPDKEETDDFERMEDMLLFLPEFLLIGLQKYHKDEYGFDYESGAGKEEQIEKSFALIDEYCDIDGCDVMTLYKDLQEEMLNDGFLASLFQKETVKATKIVKEQK